MMKKMISWVEIPSLDFDRAVDFYNAVFNFNLEKRDFKNEKMACFPNKEGAISFAPDFKPSKDGLLVSFNVIDSIEQTKQRIEANGGSIIQPKTKIEAEGHGFFSIFVDSEGNKLGLYADN